MEHFKNPFGPPDFATERVIENGRFLDDALTRARTHRYFSHPFLSSFPATTPTPETVTFVLSSTYQLVAPFTAFLCALGGQTPDLRSRFALLDNIYEEMGCGDFEAAHPRLYLKMLASIGVSEEAAATMPALSAIRRINDQLREVVESRPFSVACAMLALAEAVIPPTFPVFVTLAQSAFPHVDMTFFDRHGTRDEEHSDDAATLFALSAESAHFPIVEAEMRRALDHRSELLDDWMAVATNGVVRARSAVIARPRPLSERPPRSRPLSERPPRSRPLSTPPSRRPSVPPSR
ncbi:MAG: iron-containing redox enzyme family protein [Labilithrix sp.]|nr:iron-containing redox enzyme family protein [Labilithrix sp.]